MSFKSLTGFDGNGKTYANAADAVSANDLVTFQQLQAYIAGLQWKQNGVKVATTANGTLATSFANGSTIDGVALGTGDRILIKDQTTGQDNGIYTVNASGAPTRATDADSTAELENAAVFVHLGTANADKAFTQTSTITTVGTTVQVWAPFGGGGTYTAGNGLQLSANAFSILLDTGSALIVSGTGLKIDTSLVPQKFSADCVATTNPQTFTHNLGTKDVDVTIRRKSDDVILGADVVAATTNTVTVDFGGAPTSAQYRVTVMG